MQTLRRRHRQYEKLLVLALDNLISNAVQYSPENTRVGIGVRYRDGAIEVAVTDQGLPRRGMVSEIRPSAMRRRTSEEDATSPPTVI